MLGSLSRVKPSPDSFSDFDDDLRAAFQRETELFFDSQVRDDRSVIELLSANYTFVNERLARHYGIPNVSGNQFRRVTLSDNRRAGILGQASFLMATSHENRTSLTARAKWVFLNVLGVPFPPPPPVVDALKEDQIGKSTSVRRQMEEHVNRPGCAECHSVIDPMGYGLENFNAIGQWRDEEGQTPIDASRVFPDGTKVATPAEFRMALLDRRDALLNRFAEKLLAYALRRTPLRKVEYYEIPAGVWWTAGQRAYMTGISLLEYYEMPAVRAILREAAASNYRWSSLIAAVAKSAPFQAR